MKIYFCHSKNFNFIDEFYTPIKGSALYEKYECIFPHEDPSTTIKSKDIIRTSDLIVAEVSHQATGMGIELGWADAFNVPIICIYRTGSKISGSLRFISQNILGYSDSNDLVKKLSEIIDSKM